MMTDEERQRIMAEARRHVETPTNFPPREPAPREWRVRRVEREADEAPADRLTDAENSRAWTNHLRSEIASAIASEHATMIEVLGEVINHQREEFAQLLADERRAAESELRIKLSEIRLELVSKMTATIEGMQRVLRGNHKNGDDADDTEPGGARVLALRREIN